MTTPNFRNFRYESSVYDDRQIQRDFDYSVVDRVGKFILLMEFS